MKAKENRNAVKWERNFVRSYRRTYLTVGPDEIFHKVPSESETYVPEPSCSGFVQAVRPHQPDVDLWSQAYGHGPTAFALESSNLVFFSMSKNLLQKRLFRNMRKRREKRKFRSELPFLFRHILPASSSRIPASSKISARKPSYGGFVFSNV